MTFGTLNQIVSCSLINALQAGLESALKSKLSIFHGLLHRKIVLRKDFNYVRSTEKLET